MEEKGQRPKLRSGYTTGSCAAAAAKAAAWLLLGKEADGVRINTPSGKALTLFPEEICRGDGWVSCAVRKDSGDDPDVTNGILVYAKVSFEESPDIVIAGGVGIGRVTKPGLACPVGEAAINPTPRAMITQAVREACGQAGRTGGMRVELSIPAGLELAARTYNPRMGIVGGISVLGTTGIVEPMSERALIASILLEQRVRRAAGDTILLATPGNYGEEFAKSTFFLDAERMVKCSNYIGEMLEGADDQGFEGVLLIGHAGKLVKLAAGIVNTHSRQGDGRAEILTAHAAMAGADRKTAARLMECITVDDALDVLDRAGLKEAVLESVLRKIAWHLDARKGGVARCGAVLFSNRWGLLGYAGPARELLRDWNAKNPREAPPSACARHGR